MLGMSIERAQPAAVQAAGNHHLLHGGGKVTLEMILMGQIADLVLLQSVREFDFSRKRRVQPQDRLHQRALARAVFADDAQIIALRYGEINAF